MLWIDWFGLCLEQSHISGLAKVDSQPSSPTPCKLGLRWLLLACLIDDPNHSSVVKWWARLHALMVYRCNHALVWVGCSHMPTHLFMHAHSTNINNNKEWCGFLLSSQEQKDTRTLYTINTWVFVSTHSCWGCLTLKHCDKDTALLIYLR